ncbi:alpha/beta hydrolase [Desertifilum tharense]|uniref:Alpha/beta hydrolase n=2 Tax=Desertifilum tharense IPPAS B-1220 TaxID=1781255 RepID=A0A1E5QLE6_9CYAN|nr:alpha/beta hydrolase [Desertifilum tharense]MDA0209976.1 alpha/beta hydrolase [Cyanobacteria bacterium FC1]OEJ75424.1 alpha/beta hydrolase [Desertifilum tharense IPPAS B-1220]
MKSESRSIHVLCNGTLQAAAYVESDPSPQQDRPTVLMLHGFMGTKYNWRFLMELLSPEFHCISLDLLGFGDSGKPDMRYDIAIEVDFVQQVVKALNLQQFYIFGHSFGGWVASAYALKYPQAVLGLVLAAPAGIRDETMCVRYRHLRYLLWPTPLVDVALNMSKPLATAAGKQIQLATAISYRQLLNSVPAVRSFLVDRLRPEDLIDTVEQEIHRLQIPTLVMIGSRDEIFPLWHAQTYAERIPNATLHILPNASHALLKNHYQEMLGPILNFMKLAQPEYESPPILCQP